MDYRVTELSLYVRGILKPGSVGIVHSSYKRAVNLWVDGQMVALQPAGSPLSPVSMITDLSVEEFGMLEIEPGKEIYVGKFALNIPLASGENICFWYNRGSMVDLKLRETGVTERFLETAADLHRQMKLEKDVGTSSVFLHPETAGLIPEAVFRCLRDVSLAMESERWEEASLRLCGLLGLGIGLTPSGDDFLCGVLAGIFLCGQSSHPFAKLLRESLMNNLCRTNDLSRAFLGCALEGQYTSAIHRIGVQPASQIIAEMKKIGSTSGMDTLCGIEYIFQKFTKKKREEKEYDF